MAIYLHYPNFNGKASNALTIGNVDIGEKILGNCDILPVGHGEIIVFDKDNNAKHIRYGRYLNGTGVIRPTVKGGNWKITSFPKRNKNEDIKTYLKRVKNLPEMSDSKLGKYEAIEIPNIDTQKVIKYATNEAYNDQREDYNISNTCATGASNALKAGMNKQQLNKVNNPLNYLTNLFSISNANNGILQTIYGMIPGSTNSYAANMRKIGTQTIIK